MIRYKKKSGIARITWDMPDRSVNVINNESKAAFALAVDKALEDDSVRGVIIGSAKVDFIAGADLQMLLAMDGVEQVLALCEENNALQRRIETGGKPFVAVINGHALGGGLELCLSCHYRIAADKPSAQIGLPEVTLGLLPGGGGTQRLPRLIGIDKALPLLLEGRHVSPQVALDLGIVDQIVASDDLYAAAERWIEEDGNARKPWYDRGYRPPEPAVQSANGYELFVAGNAQLHSKTFGNYPAPKAIMSCVYEGMQVPIDVGLKIESNYIAKLFTSKETQNMIRTLFFSVNDAKKLGRRPQNVPPVWHRRIGVVGAGLMGSAIAYVSALNGIEVTLLDTTPELANQGKAYGREVMDTNIARGQMTETRRDEIQARITTTTDFADLTGCELVIEAVFEDRDIKTAVTKMTESMIAEGAIYASSTATLPITGLAKASSRPANFIGLHFFSPVDRMVLVEVIRGEETSDECLARALDYIKRIGKAPIVVNDSLGFYTSRVVAKFVEEGIAMVGEGISPALIENGGKLAGFPLGPLALADEVSLQLMYNTRRQRHCDLGVDYVLKPAEKVLGRFVEEFARLGRKSGGGFYDYPEETSKRLWPGLREHYPMRNDQPNLDEVKKRLMFVQSVDAARCLEEEVLTDPRDGDVGSILGWGFPSYTGGAVSYIDFVGAGKFVEECERMCATYGERFAPPVSLREMAAVDGAFYPK